MNKAISRILKYGTIISTLALIVSVLIQIFARFFIAQAPAWTEEASRLFFIYAMAFASGLALKNNYYVSLDVFFARLSPSVQKALLLAIPFFTLILFLLMSYYSIQFVIQGHQEYSPSLGIRMSWVFSSLVLMCFSLTYFSWLEVRREFRKMNKS